MSKAIDWAAEVAGWRESGKPAREFCEARGYSATRLYWWSSQLKRLKSAPSRKAEFPIARVARKVEAAVTIQSASLVIQVGQVRVEVRPGTDRATLSLVLQSLIGMSAEANS